MAALFVGGGLNRFSAPYAGLAIPLPAEGGTVRRMGGGECPQGPQPLEPRLLRDTDDFPGLVLLRTAVRNDAL